MQSLAPATVATDTEFAESAISPADFDYRMAGDFSRAGRPVESPHSTARLSAKLRIMKRQVTVAEYRRCIERRRLPPDRLSRRPSGRSGRRRELARRASLRRLDERTTGLNYRLPTDQEWSFAAAESARSEVAPLVDPSDPAQAWIARYEAESARAGLRGTGAAAGSARSGSNSNGLRDVGGNVWEWTDTCFVRATLDGGSLRVTNTNCGVRVVQGAHRTYMTDFIRDPRTGGCAAGVPPANLGFRLVVETGFPGMRGMVSNFFGSLRRS